MTCKIFAALVVLRPSIATPPATFAQSAGWTEVIWREPQVRYLLADMTLGGSVQLYRDYATKERDPDSREAIRLWDAGVRVVNTNEFERRWVTNQFGKVGRVMRVVFRGSNRTLTGNEDLLTSDMLYNQDHVRLILLDLTLGGDKSQYDSRHSDDPECAEAMRRWEDGARALNTHWFEARPQARGKGRGLFYRGTNNRADGMHIRLNSDAAYPEVNVPYFLADMMLRGLRDFYDRTAEAHHEMGCQEAVARFDAGVKIANLDQFERKQVDGRTVITRKGSRERLSGMLVVLSTD